MIAHAVSGADYGANSATADDVSVTVDDDETAVTLTVNPAAVDEDGGGASVTVTGTLDGVTRDEPTTLTVSVGGSDDAAIAGTDYVAADRGGPQSPDWQAPAVTYSGVQTRCPSSSGEATLPQPGPVGTRDSKISPQHVSTNFAG